MNNVRSQSKIRLIGEDLCLYRSGFIVKRFPLADQPEISLGYGFASKHWLVWAILSLFVFLSGLLGLIVFFVEIHYRLLWTLATGLSLLVGGGISLSSTLKKSPILKIKAQHYSDRIILSSKEEEKKYETLLNQLKEKGLSVHNSLIPQENSK